MAKIWFGRPGTQPDQGDLKGGKEVTWCKNNLGPLTFISAPGRLPRMPDEESPIPPAMRNYKFVVVEIEEVNDDLAPAYYLSTLTPKEAGGNISETWLLNAGRHSIHSSQPGGLWDHPQGGMDLVTAL